MLQPVLPLFASTGGELVVQPVSFSDAKKACQEWHYTRDIAPACAIRFGLSVDGRFDGVIAFKSSSNNTPNVMQFWEELAGGPTCELSRIALRPQSERQSPTTRYVSLAMSKLKEMRLFDLVYSYSDPRFHEGTLYRACSFHQYESRKGGGEVVWLTPDGKTKHKRAIERWNKTTPQATKDALENGWRQTKIPNKDRFFFPLTKRCRKRIERMIEAGDKRILR